MQCCWVALFYMLFCVFFLQVKAGKILTKNMFISSSKIFNVCVEVAQPDSYDFAVKRSCVRIPVGAKFCSLFSMDESTCWTCVQCCNSASIALVNYSKLYVKNKNCWQSKQSINNKHYH